MEENEKPKTKNESTQDEYRRVFKINDDKYCIKVDMDKYIIYVTKAYAIRWLAMKRFNKDWTDEDNKNFDTCIAKLQRTEALPYAYLSKDCVISFITILGSAYELIFERNFNIDGIIEEAIDYLHKRNIEASRMFYLISSSLALIVLGFLYLLYYYNILSLGISNNVINVLFFGALGSYVSIWITNGKRKDDGYASKSLHYFESVSRIIVGMIFAIIAYCLFKCGLIFSREGMENIPQFYPILGFVSGFFERFIPSLMTKYTNSIDDKNANKEDDIVHKKNASDK